MRTALARLVALCLILAACGGSAEPEGSSTTAADTTTSSDSTSTTAPTTTSTTSTTLPDLPKSLVNGLPVEDETLLDRRILAVKIDNHPSATPQTGIELADMMIELNVEGITRFISIWHESDTDIIGPMRSGRPTDAYLLTALNEPTFVISGAQQWVQSLIRSKDIFLLGEQKSDETFRDDSRRAPHNLYGNTFLLRDLADRREFPNNPPTAPLWEFGEMPADAASARLVNLDLNIDVIWRWSSIQSAYLRTAYESVGNYIDVNGEEQPIAMPVMIVLETEQYTENPGSGQSGKSLPSSRVVGEGKAWVFADGKYVEGTWTRETDEVWFTLTNADGSTMLVPPGKSWMTLVPPGGVTIN